MCSEICEKIDIRDIQQLIVMNCAPVLAGIKISNLLVTDNDGYRQICELLRGMSIEIYVLSRKGKNVTILLYNRNELQKYLNINMNASFMRKNGYRTTLVDKVLMELSVRYKKYQLGIMGFPHELGIVLGYPLEDVYGFICNHGENYICSGYWKVYSQAEKTLKTFKSYDDVTENMMIRLLETRNLREMLAKKISIG